LTKQSPAADLADSLAPELAPPRRNGELIFEDVWHSRAFGLAVSLCREDIFEWSEFRQTLIARIAAWERTACDEPYVYYEHWLGALEDVLTARGIVDAATLDARTALEASTDHHGGGAGAHHGHEH
jgi:nitrile hydratase accessory protein